MDTIIIAGRSALKQWPLKILSYDQHNAILKDIERRLASSDTAAVSSAIKTPLL